MLPYQELHELLCNADGQNNTLLCEIVENKDDDKLFIPLLEVHTSLDSFEVINSTKPPKLVGPEVEYNCTPTQIDYFPMENCAKKVP